MQPHSSGDGGPVPALTRLAVTQPWVVLSAWIAIVAVLGVIGLGIDGKLSAGGLQVSNSESSHAREMIGGNFGDSATVPVLLRGPRADVKRQGKELTATLAKRPGIRVLSPWTTSSGSTALRPTGDRALLLLSVDGTHEQIAARSEAAETLVAKQTSAPVRATVTGLPLLTRDGTRSSLSAVHRAELIALPLLLIALLLVFRSPLAAAIPVVFGAATIAASTGALALLAGAVRLDAFALAVSCMVGLALAVDYSLLFVSRLREEIARGRHEDIESAVASAAAPTTRTVAAAAAAIVVAMGVAAAMSPGTALLAAALGVTAVAVLAAATAMLAVPAILVVAGPWLDAGSVPAGNGNGHGISAGIARAATHRPALALGAALLLLAASIPVLGLKTGAPAAQSLPSDSTARASYDSVSKAMGPGWTEPFEIVAVTRKGAVTTAARLAALERAQRKLARDPAVRAVLGPGSIAGSARKLRSAGRRAVNAESGAPRDAGKRLRRIDANVSTAASGVDSLRSSLSTANAAAGKISAGSRDLRGGVGSLKNGLSGAGSGARRLAAQLSAGVGAAKGLAAQSSSASGSARDVRDGASQLSTGLGTLASSARDLQGRLQTRANTLDRVRSGIRAQRSAADASLAAAERSVTGFSATAIRARAAIHQARQALAADGAAALDEPVRQLGTDSQYAGKIADATPASEAARLTTAVGRLAANADAITKRVRSLGGSVGTLAQGGDSLVNALDQLDGGADKLSSAVGAVGAGVDGLANGVRSGEQRSGELSSGLRDASSAVRGLSGSKGEAASPQPAKATASFFDSGYFLLAALESGNGDAPFGVNVDKGGQGARIVVVPRYPASDPRTQALYARLRASAAHLGQTLGAETAVGGPAAVLSDYDAASRHRLPLIVLVLTLVTALLLAALLRSVVVAGIGVVLNLLAVGATLGLLRLLFQGDTPLLGGPGEIDAVAVTAIFGVVFALSIDYQVFIVSRVREEWLRTGDAAAAVQLGLARTARVVTGAALSMLGVFFAFGLADVASLRQFGVGLAIAVIIDATLVRLVLLPAALHLAGDWAWWSPKLGFEDARPPQANVLAWEAPAGRD
jgi:RND superfamily putative drug exporter